MITERVEAMSGDAPTPDPARRLLIERNIIDEQNEKLFACSLRIGQLNAKQLASLIAKLAGREFAAIRDEADGSEGLRRAVEAEKEGVAAGTTRSDGPAGAGPVRNGQTETTGQGDGGTVSQERSSADDEVLLLSAADVRFTISEIQTLQRRVPQYFAAVGRLPSPRAIRMLTFKIQLYRFLLQQRSKDPADWSVEGILDALTEARSDFDEAEDEKVTIARQVV